MRTIWALVVVCLVAAHGVRPAGAPPHGRGEAQVQRGTPRLQRPAVTAARHATSLVATRARGSMSRLRSAVLPAPPALLRPTTVVIAEGDRRPERPDLALLRIRSARGPPVR